MTEHPVWKMERGTLWVIEFDSSRDSGDTLRVTPRIPVALAEVNADAAEALAKAMNLPDAEPILRRFRSGRRCFVARADDQIAAYGWLSQGRECVGELEREIAIGSDEAYIWDCATLPAFRQQRLYSALLHFITEKMRAEGVRRVWIGTGKANRPSLQGFANAGFRPAIDLTYWRFTRLNVTWISGVEGAPLQVVNAARRMFTASHERRVGPLAVGYLALGTLTTCLQLQG